MPDQVLRDAAYPAMFDPVIGPEIAVDVPATTDALKPGISMREGRCQ